MELRSAIKPDAPGVWMRFMDAEVLIRYVPMDRMQSILRQATEFFQPPQRGANMAEVGGQFDEKLDTLMAARLIGREAVCGWRGFTLEGKDYPYSPEACDALTAGWGEFSAFVAEACADLMALEKARQETVEKKS